MKVKYIYIIIIMFFVSVNIVKAEEKCWCKGTGDDMKCILAEKVDDAEYIESDSSLCSPKDKSDLFEPGHLGNTTCESLFSDSNGKPNSFYTIVQHGVNIIKFGAIILVVVLSIMEFFKAITSKDDVALKKAMTNTGLRLILGIAIFFLPTILNLLLKLFNIGGDSPLCGIH